MTDPLKQAIQNLQEALDDEAGGNDQVRDCAFEVVEAYQQEPEPSYEDLRLRYPHVDDDSHFAGWLADR